jgi:hypothetical protein
LIKQQDSVNAGEARCHLLGELAARAAGEPQPDLGQWAEIEQVLAGRPGFWRRRWLVLVFPALAVLALWIGAGRTLSHVSQGCMLAPDGSFSVPDARECTVMLDEGTRIILGKASSGRLHKLGFRSGARLDLDKGHAALSVVHRLLGRWQVLAGPFAVRVTGTKFEVDWAPGQGRFGVRVSEGRVSADGGPLRDRAVSAGHRLEVDTATGYVIDGDLGTGVLATAEQATSAEAALQAAAESDAVPTPAVHAERRRGAPSGKIGIRNPPLVARLETGAPNPEIPAATPEPGSGDWTASSAADDGPAPAASGPRRLTIGKNGELVGGATGPVLATRGSGTRFTAPASSAANHFYLDAGSLCTHGRISALTCVDDPAFSRRCDGDTNWGVLIRWYPRKDREAWGSHANSRMSIEFQGEPSRYRLFAHREGDPARRAYCVGDYGSGQTVKPSDFTLDCWSGGQRLSDFTRIDYFALHVPSEDTWLTFRFCLSAISLY